MMEARSLGVTINRPWRDLYEAFWRPEMFPEWAAGLSGETLRQDGDSWHAAGPGGDVAIRFTPHNAFGVMDHWVTVASDAIIYVPMRVVANGDGAEVTLTLFRQSDMDDQQFAADIATVSDDLARLKTLAES